MKLTTVFGPPGCGKTSTLVGIAEAAINAGNKVLFLSFSRAAVAEVTGRIQNSNLTTSTIHALAYKNLNLNTGSVVDAGKLKAFGDKTGFQFRGMDSDELQEGDEYLQVVQYADNRMMEPMDAYDHFGRPGTMSGMKAFAISYDGWKKAYGYMDFNDMLRGCTELEFRGIPPVVLLDEAQDCSPLQWAVFERIVANVERVYTAGDDDQCQPSGAMVETQLGPIRIEQLDPKSHKVRAYSPRHGIVLKPFVKSSRVYAGDILTVSTTGGNVSSYTPDHICVARFNVREEHIKTMRVVYLMRRGNQFRLGETKAFIRNKNGVMFHPKARMRQEDADELWVLRCTHSAVESRQWEQLYSLTYGIPTTIFDYTGLRLKNYNNRGLMEFIHRNLDVKEGAIALLADLNMSISHSLWTTKVGGQKTFNVRAMNLVPELMEVGEFVSKGKSPVWSRFSVKRKHFSGMVYSLGVSDFETYFADGILTHNCIHEWSGAHPHGMIEFSERHDGTSRVLERSYRVPRKVHALAMSTLNEIGRRVSKTFAPHDADGRIERYGDLDDVDFQWIKDAPSGMILVRDKWRMREVQKRLHEVGLPYGIIGGTSPWTNGYAAAIRGCERPEGPTQSEMKAMVKFRRNLDHDWGDIRKLGWRKAIEVPHYLRPFYEGADLFQPIHTQLSTVHQAKGREADAVLVDLTMSQRVQDGVSRDRDAELRVLYVALTRTRDALMMCCENSLL